MMKDGYAPLGTPETVQRNLSFFKKQIQILEDASHQLLKETSHFWLVITALTLASIDTLEAILALAKTEDLRDCFVLARTAYETIINICFICAEGDEAAERAYRHARQKAYRDLNRESNINESKLVVKWTGQVDLANSPELQSAVMEFTSKKGREITNWTPQTVQEQIEAIDTAYKHLSTTSYLQFALMFIYRHASEIIHGTFFGVLYILGQTNPSRRGNSSEERLDEQRTMMSVLLVVLSGSIHSLIKILVEKMPSLAELAKESSEAIREQIQQA